MPKKKRKKRNRKQHPLMLMLKIGLIAMIFFVFSIAFMAKQLLDRPEGVFISYEQQFIEKAAENAILLESTHGIRPSVAIAQAILESNWGKSELAQEEQNYYGIKGYGNEEKYVTKEFENNEWIEIETEFRTYDSMKESMEDYADLLRDGTEWDEDLYQEVIEAPTYEASAEALKTAGYATDPEYPEKVISLIEEYDLDQYDRENRIKEGTDT